MQPPESRPGALCRRYVGVRVLGAPPVQLATINVFTFTPTLTLPRAALEKCRPSAPPPQRLLRHTTTTWQRNVVIVVRHLFCSAPIAP